MSKVKAWKEVKAGWRDVVLVCRKCEKKLEGGFGPEGTVSLSKALRRSVERDGNSKKPKPRRRRCAVITVPCLDICPRDAVVVLRGDDPGRWLVVPEGADLAEVADRLGIGHSGRRHTVSV